MAVSSSCIKEVAEFLESIGVEHEVALNFEREKVDKATVPLMSDDQLKKLGLVAMGDRLKLQNWSSERKFSDREQKLEKLRDLIATSRAKKGKSNSLDSSSSRKKPRLKETLRFEFGWKHWESGRYKQRKVAQGGGNRIWEVPRNSSLSDCLDIAKSLFFPNGQSPIGPEKDMFLALGNFGGEILGDLIEDGRLVTFNASKYKHSTGLSHPRLYLLSKPLSECSWEGSSDDVSLSQIASGTKEVPLPVESQPLTSKVSHEGNESSSLIGSSEERGLFFKDLELQVQESLAIDRRKDEDRKEERELRERKMAESIQQAQVESSELEDLRHRRELRVPPEPTADNESIHVCVRHITLGPVKRKFGKRCTMMAVYDWVGSLGITPKYFSLSLVPKVAVYPEESVSLAAGNILFMDELSKPLPTSQDEAEISFYDAVDSEGVLDSTIPEVPQSPEELSGWHQDNWEPSSTDMHLPDVLLEDDVHMTESGKVIHERYQELEKERKKAADLLEVDHFVTVKRHSIVQDLIEIYRDASVNSMKLVLDFEDSAGTVGDGVLREAYTLFWDAFLRENCDGSGEFALKILPHMAHNFEVLGRIISHHFIQCGSFPVQLARASIHQALFGSVTEDCLIDSFLQLLPPVEREVMSAALEGKNPFPTDEVIDILDEFSEKKLPSATNIRTLVLNIATTEFVIRPFLPLTKMKEGMGSFWNSVSKEMVDSIYHLSKPTPGGVLDQLICCPKDVQESKVFRWLRRYVKEANKKLLSLFLHFCTATQVLLPDRTVAVQMEGMSEAAMRPKARTCFNVLIVPRNYVSYNQMKENLDYYLHRSDQWDLED